MDLYRNLRLNPVQDTILAWSGKIQVLKVRQRRSHELMTPQPASLSSILLSPAIEVQMTPGPMEIMRTALKPRKSVPRN
jgi:hypothetical protein